MRKAYNLEVRRIASILAISALFACKSAGDSPNAVKQYRAWCFSYSRPVGDWQLDRATAEADVKKHLKFRAHHRVSVKVWTGDPAITGAK